MKNKEIKMEKWKCCICENTYENMDRENYHDGGFVCMDCLSDVDKIMTCIDCGKLFLVGEDGNELGFCKTCQDSDEFPYDLDAYYKDYDNDKVAFKGTETRDRGLLEPYRKETKFDRKINDGGD